MEYTYKLDKLLKKQIVTEISYYKKLKTENFYFHQLSPQELILQQKDDNLIYDTLSKLYPNYEFKPVLTHLSQSILQQPYNLISPFNYFYHLSDRDMRDLFIGNSIYFSGIMLSSYYDSLNLCLNNEVSFFSNILDKLSNPEIIDYFKDNSKISHYDSLMLFLSLYYNEESDFIDFIKNEEMKINNGSLFQIP